MTDTLTPPMGPATGERPALSTLRGELSGLGGDYAAIADVTTPDGQSELQRIFAEQTRATIDYAVNNADGDEAITPEEAVSILIDEGRPFVDDHIRQNAPNFVDDWAAATDDEKDEANEAAEDELRDRLSHHVRLATGAVDADTDTDTPGDRPEKVGILGRIKSFGKRFSLTAKKTRAAYRDYRARKQEVDETEAGSDERAEALDRRAEARKHLVGHVAKTTGILAVTSFLAGNVITNRSDFGEWVTPANVAKSVGLGIVGTAAALGVERVGLAERYRNAKIRGGMGVMNMAGKVLGGWKETRLNDDDIPEGEDRDRLADLTTKVDEGDDWLEERREADDFDEENDDEYKYVKAYRDAYDEQHQELWNQLADEHGERKWTTWGKVRMAIGAAVVAGAGVYLWKFGVPFTGRNGDTTQQAAQNSGNGSGDKSAAQAAVENAQKVASDAKAAADQAQNPGAGKGNFNQAIFDSLPSGTGQKEQYLNYTDEQRSSFNGMVEVTKQLQADPANQPWDPEFGVKVMDLSWARDNTDLVAGDPATRLSHAQFDAQFAATVGKAA